MVLVVASQKGGVGKTTTAVNVAVCLARRGGRVLAVDADPQFTMTSQLGVDVRSPRASLVDALARHVSAADAVLVDVVDGIDLIPAARELAGVEMALVGELGRERFLHDALEPLMDRYATVVIDTPPNLGLLTVNALVCADIVLAPVSCEDAASLQGLVELRATLTKLGRLCDRQPELQAVLTRWTPQRVMSQLIGAAVTDLGVVCAARVPARVAVAHAGAEHVPLARSAPDSCVTLAYERVAEGLGVVIAR